MPFISCDENGSEHLANLRRLVGSRWLALSALGLLVLFCPVLLDIPLPQEPMLAILALTGLINAITWWRLRQALDATPYELFSHLLIDVAALSALCFFSGGATNPLVSMLLPPVAIAALTLPVRCVVAVGGSALSAYSLLMIYYVPLPLADATRATRLHLIGMWLTFAVSALMIAWFVVRMTRLIRERDAELAAAREQGLRDERVLAIGTLAAGAAHELGTPLATMALLAGELIHEPELSAALREDIELMRQQIQVCKGIITGLSHRAGVDRLENSSLQPVDRWIDSIRQHWHASRPQAESRLTVHGTQPAPTMVADPRLEQALLNLLNNAANASQKPIALNIDWTTPGLVIEIHDCGPGFPPEILERGGMASFPAHPQGSGIGLMLTRSAIEQLGGRLTLSNPSQGGALARIDLPQVSA
jgi:two-component system sensor histidine kinase RegB